MATTVDVEFVFPLYGNFNEGLPDGQPATPVRGLAVTGVATAAESRPVVPTGPDSRRYYAVVTALGGPVYVAWGTDPTATSSGLRVDPGAPRAITCNPGDKLSFITAPQLYSLGYGASVTLTRTADTTAYTGGDVIGVGTGAGNTTKGPAAIEFANMGPSGGRIMLTAASLRIDVASIPSGMTSFRLHLYNVTPPSALVDNDPWDLPAGDRDAYLGYVDIGTPVDVGSTLYVEAIGVNKQVKLAGTSLFGYLVTIGGYTPSSAAVKKIDLQATAL